MKLSRRLIAVLRGLLFTVAALATLVALFVVVENWRGDRAWAAVERDLLARGERLDLAAFQPRSVPDEQNYFKAPLLARILYVHPEDAAQKKLLTELRLPDFHALGRFRVDVKDFAALRDSLKAKRLLTEASDSPAADVIRAMTPLQPFFDELRSAAESRPLAALDPRPLPFDPPHLAVDTLFHLGQALGVRAAAQLELGRVDDAHADLVAVQRLANELAAPPLTLLTVLVGHALHGIAAGVISDGCQRHVWTDARLADFQRRHARFEPLARFANALRCERASFVHILDARPKLMARDFQFPPWLFFHGWAQQNKVTYCRELDRQIFAAISTAPERIFPERLPARPPTGVEAATSKHPYDRVASLGLNNVANILDGFGTQAEQLRLNAIAWAIERHRLAHGRAPQKLEGLVPAFLPALPMGIVDGKPLRYESQPGGRPRLYALGKNGVDDGGKGDDITLPGSPNS